LLGSKNPFEVCEGGCCAVAGSGVRAIVYVAFMWAEYLRDDDAMALMKLNSESDTEGKTVRSRVV
jgi:hypothetical protein